MNQKKVVIIGAGCGDPELITLKAVRYLQQAEVILVDRLVSEQILSLYANPQAEIIYVGKQAHHASSLPQQEINQLLVNAAQNNSLVVRLKGGDISIFANLLDELEALCQQGIAYELIPGISAASGAAAYAGIPLTARNHATAIRFLTYYDPNMFTAQQLQELGQSNDTLVFYMSTQNIMPLLQKLLPYNQDIRKKIAIISQATTPFQQVFVYDLQEYASMKLHNILSPSIFILGSVVSLYEQYQWLPNALQQQNYFQQYQTSPV